MIIEIEKLLNDSETKEFYEKEKSKQKKAVFRSEVDIFVNNLKAWAKRIYDTTQYKIIYNHLFDTLIEIENNRIDEKPENEIQYLYDDINQILEIVLKHDEILKFIKENKKLGIHKILKRIYKHLFNQLTDENKQKLDFLKNILVSKKKKPVEKIWDEANESEFLSDPDSLDSPD